MQNLNYDPMQDFYKNAIAFLFRQTPAIVICFVACFVLYNEMIRRDNLNKAEISRINVEWSAALKESRNDWRLSEENWRMCEQRREALAVEVAALKAQFRKFIKK